MIASHRAALVVVLAGLSAAACAHPAAPGHDIALSDYSIAAPSSLPAGYATFRTSNSGKEMHQAGLVRLDSGKTAGDFVHAMQTSGPPPAWVTWLGGPQNSGSVSINLAPGQYVWYCIIPGPDGVPHMMKGMVAPMTVTAATIDTSAHPVADINVTMHDYQWDLSAVPTAGSHTFRIETAPGQPHEFVVIKLAPGKTAADMVAWADKPVGPPPGVSLEGTAVQQAGQVEYATVDFTSGHYALFCFVPDAADGKSHASHGMVREFTLQ
jgi:hypothetical protein